MIVFANKGVIDPRSITCFGVSSKEGQNAIGFFGTGLKYALAILLREGCSITIRSGGETYEFTTAVTKIRNDEFKFVQMNGAPMTFTTELGKTWATWQALRELYCNCVDEHGNAFEAEADDPWPTTVDTKDLTVICVSGRAITEAWQERAETILGSKPLASLPGFEIHPGESKYVYYKGVRAHTLPHKSAFTYNILNKLDLTEDRTIKYSWDVNQQCRHAFMNLEDKKLIEQVIGADKSKWEAHFDFDGELPGATFLEVAKAMMVAFDSRLNPTAKKVVRTFAMQDLGAVSASSLDDIDSRRLAKAVEFCRCLGHNVDEYKIIVTDFLGDGVLGRAQDDIIYLSRRTFMMGSKMVVGTLLEEYWHLKYKLHDECRDMQNFLIDLIVSMGERMTERTL